MCVVYVCAIFCRVFDIIAHLGNLAAIFHQLLSPKIQVTVCLCIASRIMRLRPSVLETTPNFQWIATGTKSPKSDPVPDHSTNLKRMEKTTALKEGISSSPLYTTMVCAGIVQVPSQLSRNVCGRSACGDAVTDWRSAKTLATSSQVVACHLAIF